MEESRKKVCSKCSEEKILKDFDKRKEAPDGYRGVCKKCKWKPFERKVKYCGKCSIFLGSETLNRLCESCSAVSKKQLGIEGNIKTRIKRNLKHKEDVIKERSEILLNDTEAEVWKDIPNFEGKYQASDLGRIRCMPTFYTTPSGFSRRTNYYIVKSTYHQGYTQTPLTDFYGKIHYKGTHRWIMYAFHGESELQVDHINGIRDDNNLINLRYVTARENNNYRKDNIPDYFTSSFYGVYKQGKGWTSYININGEEHYLGNYTEEIDAHNIYMKAWKEWDELGKLPEKYVNPNKTSQIDGIDFHKASNKWRVRLKDRGLYVGIFETESLAERVLNIVLYLVKRDIKIDKNLVKKIRRKYTTDNRFKYLINTETGEEFHCLETASKSLGISPSTLHSKLNKNLVNDTPIKYK